MPSTNHLCLTFLLSDIRSFRYSVNRGRVSQQGRPPWHNRAARESRVDRGNFTPSRSQIPDVRLSPHPARATERRPPPSVEKRGLFLLPVGPLPTLVTCSLCSTGITPLPCYYGAVRPCPPYRYFQPRRFAACTFSLGIVG